MLVLVILAALWAVVLVAAACCESRTERSNDSIGDFNYRLDVLGHTNGTVTRRRRRVSAPACRPRRRVMRRSADVLRRSAAGVAATSLVGS